jgi:ZIP family zinc transporter
MLEAAFWGFVTSFSLVIGATVVFVGRPRPVVVALVMAFGAGALLSSVSFELIGEGSFNEDTEGIVIAMLLGSLTFVIGDTLIDRLGGEHRKGEKAGGEGSSTLGIVLGTVLDGIPESFVIGLSLISGGGAGVAFIASVFMSNIPEGIAATSGLTKTGWGRANIVWMWMGIVAISTLSAALGYLAFESGLGTTGARAQAFAAGAILTMLADTMIPEAFHTGGRWAGVVTVVGFILALSLTAAE